MSHGKILFGFKGRIPRKTYWLATLAFVLVAVAARLFALHAGDDAVGARGVAGLVSLAMLYPMLAIGAKRWHDRDKSAWWLLLGFVPIVGQLWTLVELGFLPGTPSGNRFGPSTLIEAASGPGYGGERNTSARPT